MTWKGIGGGVKDWHRPGVGECSLLPVRTHVGTPKIVRRVRDVRVLRVV